MTSDMDLLRRFARDNSQDAFAEIVRRHVNLVYSAALRQVRSPQLAEDIAQSVFADLARVAATPSSPLRGGDTPSPQSLTPWLYAVARRTAIDVIRKESRRQLREQIAVEMNNMNATANDWAGIAPLLDDAMAALDETDRSAVLLRYFENKSLREVGEALGASEDAAQKRVSRAVERLREFFSKRNATVGASGLALLISANAVQSAPVGLAAAFSVVAPTKGIASAGKSMILGKGFWKSVLTAAPVIGTMYFLLKAELESAKSPRERQFLLCMIWLRFSLAAFVLLCGAVFISLGKKHTDLMAIVWVVSCFFLAVVVAARKMYFRYRRRQIQIEDGTWEPFNLGRPTRADELLDDLLGKSSTADSFAALSAVFGFVGCFVLIPLLVKRVLANGYWTMAILLMIWGGFGAFRWLRNWRQRPRHVFDPRFRMIAGPTLFSALLSLGLFDLLWAQGRLQFVTVWCLVINVAVVAAYAALIKVLALLQKRLEE